MALLVLFWLGRLERGEPRLAAFADVEGAFKQLLTEFGSANAPLTRQLPFWHLCNDANGKVWQLESPSGVAIATQGPSHGVTWFREQGLIAGFAPELEATHIQRFTVDRPASSGRRARPTRQMVRF